MRMISIAVSVVFDGVVQSNLLKESLTIAISFVPHRSAENSFLSIELTFSQWTFKF